jgi:hypothetical protein
MPKDHEGPITIMLFDRKTEDFKEPPKGPFEGMGYKMVRMNIVIIIVFFLNIFFLFCFYYFY